MSESTARPDVVIALPIRSFVGAKERLSAAYSESARAALARRLAHGVTTALRDHHIVVVTHDDEVADWARARQLATTQPQLRGLNEAAVHAVTYARSVQARQLFIVHADLPYPSALSRIVTMRGFVLVPDLAQRGTNVLGFPCDEHVEFGYGHGSFAFHLNMASAAARRAGAKLHVVNDRQLGLDIDTPYDLAHPLATSFRQEDDR